MRGPFCCGMLHALNLEPVSQAEVEAKGEEIFALVDATMAVTPSVGVWSHESYVAHRAKHASREAFEQALAEVPDAPPQPGDEWPQ